MRFSRESTFTGALLSPNGRSMLAVRLLGRATVRRSGLLGVTSTGGLFCINGCPQSTANQGGLRGEYAQGRT